MTSWFENIWSGFRYFFFFPIFGLLPSPLPYLLSRYLSRLDFWRHTTRAESVRRGMAQFLKDVSASGEGLDLASRRYFEVISCDEVDLFIYLFGFAKRFIRRIKIEGEGNLKEALKSRGGILLSAHFGGGFWILPFLKERGVPAHFFSADIEKRKYPAGKALYYYHRLRMNAVEKASGERTLYKKGGREELTRALKEGKWVIVLFDVPPSLVKDVVEVPFFDQKALFPQGIISIAKETHSPILPFFSFLDDGKHRRIFFEKPFWIDNVEEGVKTCVNLIQRQVVKRPCHWHLWPVAHQFFIKTRD
jgi:lauroyl/myristoyl acyltransferase